MYGINFLSSFYINKNKKLINNKNNNNNNNININKNKNKNNV